MKISISDRELVIAWNVLETNGSWGGDETTILAQAELFDALHFDDGRFMSPGGGMFDMSSVTDDLIDYDLSPEAISVLRRILSVGNQGRVCGRLSARALTRIRDAVSK